VTLQKGKKKKNEQESSKKDCPGLRVMKKKDGSLLGKVIMGKRERRGTQRRGGKTEKPTKIQGVA